MKRTKLETVAVLEWQTNYTSNYFYAAILQSRRAVKDDHVDSDNCSKGYFLATPDVNSACPRIGVCTPWGAYELLPKRIRRIVPRLVKR